MIDLFIAMFGGIYLAGKIAADNARSREADKELAEQKSNREYIKDSYAASYELEKEVKTYITKGKHIDDICKILKDDFEYVFGKEWKSKVYLPKGYGAYNSNEFIVPSMHTYWIYHLLLAKMGKVDSWTIFSGYKIGGIAHKDMCIKFADCIEKEINKATGDNIRLVMELETIGGVRRTPDRICGGTIRFESLCICPSCRLW